MRKFRYIESDGNVEREVVMTEQEVLDSYWGCWSESQWQVDPDPYFITEENCLEDWMLLMNAEEIV